MDKAAYYFEKAKRKVSGQRRVIQKSEIPRKTDIGMPKEHTSCRKMAGGQVLYPFPLLAIVTRPGKAPAKDSKTAAGSALTQRPNKSIKK